MARKKTVTTIEEAEEGAEMTLETGDLPVTRSTEETEDIDAMEYLLSLGGEDGVRYRVDRMPSRDRPGERIAFCNNYSRETLNLETIRDTFGGGTFRVTAYSAGSRYAGSKTVNIAELPKGPAPLVQQGPDLAALVSAVKGSGGSDPAMMGMFLQMMKSQGDMITAMVSRPPPAPPPGPTVQEIILMMREMNKDGGKEDTGAVSLLLKGIELGKEFAGGGGGETGLMDVAGKGLEMLRPLIERQASQPAAEPARPALAPPAAPARPNNQPAPAAPQPETDPMLRQLNWLRNQMPFLLQVAVKGADPAVYAQVLLDNLPDWFNDDDLLAQLRSPGAIDNLIMLDSRVGAYRAWFESLRTEIIAAFAEEGGEAPEESGELGT